jgi:hypothetical protein
VGAGRRQSNHPQQRLAARTILSHVARWFTRRGVRLDPEEEFVELLEALFAG